MEKLELKQIFYLLKEQFGKKLDILENKREAIVFSLYESFVFEVAIDERYNTFHARLILGEVYRVNRLLNETIAQNNDKQSIIKSFELMDKYCRLRLTDKYLEEYDKIL